MGLILEWRHMKNGYGITPLAIGNPARRINGIPMTPGTQSSLNRRRRKKLARDFAVVLKYRPIYGVQLRYALSFGGESSARTLRICIRVSALFKYFETRTHESKYREFTQFCAVSNASGKV